MNKVQNLIQISGDYICSLLKNTLKGLIVQIDFQDSESGISIKVQHEDFRDHLLFVGDIGNRQPDGELDTYEEFLLSEWDEINEKLQEFFVGIEFDPSNELEFESCSPKSEDMYNDIPFPQSEDTGEGQRPSEEEEKEEGQPLKGFLDMDIDHLQNAYANA
jgi:hypothetical protein